MYVYVQLGHPFYSAHFHNPYPYTAPSHYVYHKSVYSFIYIYTHTFCSDISIHHKSNRYPGDKLRGLIFFGGGPHCMNKRRSKKSLWSSSDKLRGQKRSECRSHSSGSLCRGSLEKSEMVGVAEQTSLLTSLILCWICTFVCHRHLKV